MKTNQLMTVNLGLGEIQIEHKTMIGNLKELFDVGNAYRINKGLNSVHYQKWLALHSTKEFIKTVQNKYGKDAFKTKRGKGGSIWAHLFILLDAAAYIDADFKLSIYEVFVEQKLLEWRDRSGDNFIELNAMVALKAEEVLGKPAHTGHYVNLAKIIKRRLNVYDWNEATPTQLRERARIEEALTTLLKVGVVKDWDHLKELAEKV